MKNIIIYLLVIIVALLETTIIPLNLTLVTVILWASVRSDYQGLSVAFLAGLLIDLLLGQNLGFSSLLYLLAVIPVYLYKRRFHAEKWQFLLPYILIIISLVNLFSYVTLLSRLLLSTITIIIFLPLVKFIASLTKDQRILSLDTNF